MKQTYIQHPSLRLSARPVMERPLDMCVCGGGSPPESSGRGFRRDRGSVTSLRLWSLMSRHPYPCPFHLYQASHVWGTLLSDLTDQTKQRRVADNHSLFLPHIGLLACRTCKQRRLTSPTHSTVMSLGFQASRSAPLSPQDFHSRDKKGTLDSSFQSPSFAV